MPGTRKKVVKKTKNVTKPKSKKVDTKTKPKAKPKVSKSRSRERSSSKENVTKAASSTGKVELISRGKKRAKPNSPAQEEFYDAVSDMTPHVLEMPEVMKVIFSHLGGRYGQYGYTYQRTTFTQKETHQFQRRRHFQEDKEKALQALFFTSKGVQAALNEVSFHCVKTTLFEKHDDEDYVGRGFSGDVRNTGSDSDDVQSFRLFRLPPKKKRPKRGLEFKKKCESSIWFRRWKSWFAVYIVMARRRRRGPIMLAPSLRNFPNFVFTRNRLITIPRYAFPKVGNHHGEAVHYALAGEDEDSQDTQPVPSFDVVQPGTGLLPYRGKVPLLFAGQLVLDLLSSGLPFLRNFVDYEIVFTRGGLQALYQLVFEYDHFLRRAQPGRVPSQSTLHIMLEKLLVGWEEVHQVCRNRVQTLIISRRLVEYLSGRCSMLSEKPFEPDTVYRHENVRGYVEQHFENFWEVASENSTNVSIELQVVRKEWEALENYFNEKIAYGYDHFTVCQGKDLWNEDENPTKGVSPHDEGWFMRIAPNDAFLIFQKVDLIIGFPREGDRKGAEIVNFCVHYNSRSMDIHDGKAEDLEDSEAEPIEFFRQTSERY